MKADEKSKSFLFNKYDQPSSIIRKELFRRLENKYFVDARSSNYLFDLLDQYDSRNISVDNVPTVIRDTHNNILQGETRARLTMYNIIRVIQ